jgi:hypothetical protein
MEEKMKKVTVSCVILLILISVMTAAAQVKVQYRCGDHGASADNHIKPHIIIINESSETIPLAQLTVRYYYTKEGSANEKFYIDWAKVGGNNVTGTFFDGYCEIGFVSSAGNCNPHSDTGEIQARFHMTDWKNYDEKDDYSWDGSITSYTDREEIALYRNGNLIWGIPPGGGQPTPDPTIVPTPLPTYLPTAPPTPAAESVSGVSVETEGMIVMEAENYTDSEGGTGLYLKHSWIERSSSSVSNGIYMYASPNSLINAQGSKDAPCMKYAIKLSSDGTPWYVWVRRKGISGSDDSCSTSVDNGETYEWHYGRSSSWTWTKSAKSYNLDSGYHTFIIWMREDGASIDKIILTKNNRYVPKNYGPEESIRESVQPTPEPPAPTEAPAPVTEPGTVWIEPSSLMVNVGDYFFVEVHINSGTQKIAAYGLYITYDSTIIELYSSAGTNGIETGPYGFISATAATSEGLIRPSGFDTAGTGPGTDLHFLTIHFRAVSVGTTIIDVSVDDLVDESTAAIGTPNGINGEVTVTGLVPGTPSATPTPMPTSAGGGGAGDTTSAPTETPRPTPGIPGAGDVWFVPSNITADEGECFDTEIHVNTGDQIIAAYGFEISFVETVIMVNTELGMDGVETGPDGFIVAINPDIPGQFIFSGFDTQGRGPGTDLNFVKIHWAAVGPGISPLDLTVRNLNDINLAVIGVPNDIDGTVTVNATTPTPLPSETPEATPTPEPIPGAGEVWFSPSNYTVNAGNTFTTAIKVNSGTYRIGSYGFEITYDPDVLGVDISVYHEGVEAGPDGFVNDVNSADAGSLIMAGVNDFGSEPGEELDFLIIHWIALAEGTSPMDIMVKNLNDIHTRVIGEPIGIGGSVTVSGVSMEPTPEPTPEDTLPPTTPPEEPGTGPGDVWIFPVSQTATAGSAVVTEVHVNTGTEILGAYGIDIGYDPAVLYIDTATATDGVEAGPDGFVTAVNPELEPDVMRVAGFDASGKGPGEDLHIFSINWIAEGTGTTAITITVINLVAPDSSGIGTPAGIEGIVTVID